MISINSIQDYIIRFTDITTLCTYFKQSSTFRDFALTYNRIEQIASIFGILSWGRALSPEYSPNPENTLYP